MASQVQICNIALSQLGAARLTSIDDDSDEARLCSSLYDFIVDSVLVEGPWNTALHRQTLAVTANTPVFDYTYEYQLPTTPFCLRVLSIDTDLSDRIEYRIEGDKLISDESEMSILYIQRITDAESYGPMLTQAIVARLTAALALPLTAQVGIADRWMQLYLSQLPNWLAAGCTQNSLSAYTCTVLTSDIR